MAEVESEAKFIWKIIKFFLLFPITLVLVLFKKKEVGALFEPIKDAWLFFWQAKVTASLIIINIMLYFTIVLLLILGVIPEHFVEAYFINHPGDIFQFKIIPLFGSMFFHAGLAHLFGNMLILLILGRVVEKHFGAVKAFAIYMTAGLISGIGDSVIRHFMNDNIGAVGASGAISGFASAAMLISPFALTFLIFGIPIPIFVVAWLFLASDIAGMINPNPADNVGHIAHLAGFFAIMITALFLESEDRKRLLKGLIINIATLVILALLWFFLIRG
ncbi:MAG: rhomboid family intramembrane serine protease [Nanoarchaeota archaeon]|nr:rhomboid family intramembrane serine protease [Nanoarchaeota archaeon]